MGDRGEQPVDSLSVLPSCEVMMWGDVLFLPLTDLFFHTFLERCTDPLTNSPEIKGSEINFDVIKIWIDEK